MFVDARSLAVSVSDPGATLSAGDGCSSVDPHTVRCGAASVVRVAAADGDDRRPARWWPPAAVSKAA